MKNIMKFSGIAVAALISLLIAAIVLLPSLINTDTFKQTLIDHVKERTGQTLSVEGDLSLSVFPWLGLKTGKVTLSQPLEISSQALLEIDSANIGVKLLPLLQKKIEIGQIELQQPKIYYAVTKDGKTSIDSFLQIAETTPDGATQDQTNTSTTQKDSLTALVITGVSIIDGDIVYDNKQKNEQHKLSNFNLETGNLLSTTPSPVSFSTQINIDGNEPFNLFVELNANINIDINSSNISANTISATIVEKNKQQTLNTKIESLLFDSSKQNVKVKSLSLQANANNLSPTIAIPFMDINLKEHSTSAIAFSIIEEHIKLNINGDIAIKHWNKNPMFKGQIQSEKIDLPAMTDKLNIDYKPSDPKAFKKLSVGTQFSGSTGGLSLHSLNINLDDSELVGDASIINFKKPSYRFDLSLGKINLDRYLPKKDDNKASEKPDNAGLAIAAPISLFKNLNANGIFRAKEIQANGATLNAIRIGIESKNKQVVITPEATLYEGKTSGTITFTETKDQSTLVIKNKLSNVNIGPLLTDTAITDQVSGKANTQVNITILDKNGRQSNNGIIEILIKNGALKGVDIKKVLDDTQTSFDKLRGKKIDGVSENAESEGSANKGDETRFAEMTATLNLNNNVISNKNLSIKAPAFRVSGKGTIELEPQTLDYLTNISIVNTNTGQGGKDREDLKGAVIPVRFYGNITEPKYKIDTRALIKENTKREVKKKKNELKEKALEKLGLTDKNNEDEEDKKSSEEKLKDGLKKKIFDELFK